MSNVMFQTFKHKIESFPVGPELGVIPELMLENTSFVMEYPSASLSETFYLYSMPSKYLTMLDMLEVGWRDRLPRKSFDFVCNEYYKKLCSWKEFVEQKADEGISTIKAIRKWSKM